jgi:hypothetical protein
VVSVGIYRPTFTVLKLGHFGKYIGNTLKILKYGAGEGWRGYMK